MPDYSLFGGVLRSDLDFPDLTPCYARYARWRLTRLDIPLTVHEPTPLGTEEVHAGVNVSLYRTDRAFRLVFDDTGAFDVSFDGRDIQWYAPPSPVLEAVRSDVLGRVLALALQLQGVTPLHGSSVAIGTEAIAFLAPKYHGKSTTAAALVSRGATLLADDMVAATHTRPPRILPGIPGVQLWPDSADRIGRDAANERRTLASKIYFAWERASPTLHTAFPFAAAYVLSPFADDPSREIRRERLSTPEAALALLGHTKIGALLGQDWRATVLRQLAELAALLPVYRLEIPRDYDRLNSVAETLWAWHQPRVEPRLDLPPLTISP